MRASLGAVVLLLAPHFTDEEQEAKERTRGLPAVSPTDGESLMLAVTRLAVTPAADIPVQTV